MLWGGHVLKTAAGTLYFAGDTGYGPHFRDIGRRLRPDVALLPIGAYEPRWFMGAQHMNPDDAVLAHRDLAAKLSLAIHWGTFQLTDEGIDAPLVALDAAKEARDIPAEQFIAPEVGETIRWRASCTQAATRPEQRSSVPSSPACWTRRATSSPPSWPLPWPSMRARWQKA